MSGDSLKIEWIKGKIPELKSHTDIPLQTIKERFTSLEIEDMKEASIGETHSVVLDELGIKEKKEMGDVIVLVGHSSGGKSTIINAIKEFEPKRGEEGSDLTGANYIYEFMEKNHEKHGVSNDDWEHLHSVLIPRKDNWHIHEAVSKEEGTNAEEYGFKPNTSIVDQTRAIKTAAALRGPVNEFVAISCKDIDDIVMNKVLEQAKLGQDTVFDILDVDKVASHPLSKEVRVKSVLVYCPFHTLSERVAGRNRKAIESGNLQEVRAGTFPLAQFAELFGPRQLSNRDEDVIDTVTRQTVEEDFDSNYDAGIEDMRRRNPEEAKRMTLDGSFERDRVRGKKELLTSLGFTELDPPHKSIELVPRKKYDVRIDSSDSSLGTTTEEKGRTAAKRILSFKTL
jgi:hypothetical protein